ncbi:hypothetical protein D9M72_457150 [compost metagenome]
MPGSPQVLVGVDARGCWTAHDLSGPSLLTMVAQVMTPLAEFAGTPVCTATLL